MISETPWGGRKEPFFSFPACERWEVRADIKNHSGPLPKFPPHFLLLSSLPGKCGKSSGGGEGEYILARLETPLPVLLPRPAATAAHLSLPKAYYQIQRGREGENVVQGGGIEGRTDRP